MSTETTNTKFSELLQVASPILRDNDEERICLAYAYIYQQLQNEAEGEQLLSTLLETARLAADEITLGANAIISIFLQPFYITAISPRDIEKLYGEKVMRILDGLARIDKIDTSKATLHSENFIKLLLTQADDVRVILIQLTKKLYKVRIIKQLDTEECQTLCHELSALYAPLAHRLGLYSIKTEMEEQSLKYLHNETYKTIAQKLAETKNSREAFIQAFIAPIKDILEKNGFKYEIKGRPKSIYSIWNKIKNSKVEFEKIYDLFAIRIILESELENEKADCWNVYSLITDAYRPNPKRLRDWISSPKNSGYESLHTTVLGPENKWVEVQIRTRRMDDIAEKGLAAHWKYKGGQANGMTSWLSRVREALENSDTIDDIDHKEESSSRLELYTDEIFVFTPKGDLRRLAKGATVLDFAYEVHSTVGDTCTGGLVNGKIVPIKHLLQNGDKIEILTAKNQTPKQDWLTFVVSSKARARIRRSLLEAEHREAEAGKDIVMRKFNQLKLRYDDETITKIVSALKLKNNIELFLLAVAEKIDWNTIKALFTEAEKPDTARRPEKINTIDFHEKVKRKFSQDDNYLVIDNNVDNIEYKLAKCCNPIRGDEIFGFLTASGGIKIHRINCPNAHEMMDRYPYRIVTTRWTNSNGNANFLSGLRVIGSDETSIASNITEIISQDSKVKLRKLSISSTDGLFEGEISLYIQSNDHLTALIKKIRNIKGIHTVERYDVRN